MHLDKRAIVERFKQALTEASYFWMTPEEKLEQELFPIWVEAVHDVHDCPCEGWRPGTCFRERDPADQRAMFPEGHPLGFEEFVSIFQEAKGCAIACALT